MSFGVTYSAPAITKPEEPLLSSHARVLWTCQNVIE